MSVHIPAGGSAQVKLLVGIESSGVKGHWVIAANNVALCSTEDPKNWNVIASTSSAHEVFNPLPIPNIHVEPESIYATVSVPSNMFPVTQDLDVFFFVEVTRYDMPTTYIVPYAATIFPDTAVSTSPTGPGHGTDSCNTGGK